MSNDKRKIENTNQISYRYLSNLLNIDDIKDNYFINDNNILIIEHKQDIEQKNEGLENLLRYANTAAEKQDSFSIYAMLGIGIDNASFKRLFIRYNKIDNKFEKETEIKIRDIFSNTKQLSSSLQHIHNLIVDNYRFESAKDLHNILIVICVSILDEDFRKYYQILEDQIDKRFITDLIELIETKITDSSVNYSHIIEKLKHVSFKNSYKICKMIYDSYNNNPRFISELFQQFKKYNDYEGANNEIWTPNLISDLIYNISKKYISKKDITILDPCIGFNSLIYPFITNNDYNIISIKGCEINSRLYFFGKLDLLIKDVINIQTYRNDFMKIESDLLVSDLSVCNPPYTKNISNNYDCLEFVIKSCESSSYSIFIFPKNRLRKNKALNKRYLESCKLIEIIELGDNIFRNVSTGDIVIIVSQKINENNRDIKTKYYDLKEFSQEYKSIPHRKENELTKRGKEILQNYIDNNTKYIEYEPSIDDLVPKIDMRDDILLDKIKSNLVQQYKKTISSIDSLIVTSQSDKDIMKDILIKDIQNIESSSSLQNIFEYIINEKQINKSLHFVHLLEYFEIVKCKTLTINEKEEGEYPIYSASQNIEAVRYINEYTIDTKNEKYIQLTRNGSIGYCFVRCGKFSITQDNYLLKLKSDYKNIIDLDINSKLLTIQISNMNFDYSNKLTKTRLQELEVNLYF